MNRIKTIVSTAYSLSKVRYFSKAISPSDLPQSTASSFPKLTSCLNCDEVSRKINAENYKLLGVSVPYYLKWKH